MIHCGWWALVRNLVFSPLIVFLATEAGLAASTIPVTIASFTADAASPIDSGTSVTLTAEAAGGSASLEYEFWLYRAATAEWTLMQAYSAANRIIWTPADSSDATYSFQVWVRSAGSLSAYEAWAGLGPLAVRVTTPVIETFTCSPAPVVDVGAHIVCRVSITGGRDVEYSFFHFTGATGQWSKLADYGGEDAITWTPAVEGTDYVQVWVRNHGATATYQDWRGTPPIQVVSPRLSLTPLTSTVSLFTTVGRPTTWVVTPIGGTAPFEFKYWLFTEATGSWSVLQDYSMENVLRWTPREVGRFAIQVWGRNAGSSAQYDAWTGSGFFSVTTDAVELLSITPNVTLPVGVGTPVSWTALASGGTGAIEYQFWLYEAGVGWSLMRDYATATAATWTPARLGTYRIQVWARNEDSSAQYESWIGSSAFEIVAVALEMTGFVSNVGYPHRTGRDEVWTATASGGSGQPLEYQFWVYREGAGWTIGQAYSPDNTFVWSPPAAGTYALQAWVRSAGDPAKFAAWLGTPLFQVLPFPNVSGSWRLWRSGSYPWIATYSNLTVSFEQSGSSLTGVIVSAGGAPSPLQGSVSASGVVYFGSDAPDWNNGTPGYFALMLDDTATPCRLSVRTRRPARMRPRAGSSSVIAS